jgi:hypothetical protein
MNMHTSGYNYLMEKLHASGREYLDGFSSDDFCGLSEAEAHEIRDVLVDRASRGDGVALDGLGKLLPKDNYLRFLEELIVTQEDGRLFYAQLTTSICRIRGDTDIWHRLVGCLERGDLATKRWVLGQIARLSVPPHVHSMLTDAVKTIVQDEHNKVVLILASGVMLELCHIKPKTPSYIEFSRRLQSPDKRERRQALTDLRTLA